MLPARITFYRKPLISLLLLAITAIASAQQNDVYCNARFKYCINYPSGLLHPQPEAQNGDGRIFTNTQKNTLLRVYGTGNWNADGDIISLQEQYKIELQNYKGKVTYNKLGKSFFVLSGISNGKIFYEKVIQLTDAFGYAYLEYPENEKQLYANAVHDILKTFTAAEK